MHNMSSHGYEYGPITNVFKSISKSFQSSSSHKSRSLPVNPTVVGTKAFNEDDLMKTLRNGATSEKVKAIQKLEESISKVSISSIPEIWYKVKGHIAPQSPNKNLRRATLSLFKTCIRMSDTATGTQLLYFKDLIGNCVVDTSKNLLDDDFDLFLLALAQLTEGGTNIYALMLSKEPLDNFLQSVLLILRRRMVQESLDSTLTEVVSFLDSCIQFNSNTFPQGKLLNIVSCTLEISTFISDPVCLATLLRFATTFVTYGSFQPAILEPIMILDASSRALEDEQIIKLSEKLFQSMLNSSISYLVLVKLTEIPQVLNKERPALSNVKTVTGSLTLLNYFILNENIGHDYDFLVESTTLISNMMQVSLNFDNPKVTEAVAKVLHSILSHPNLISQFKWSTSFLEVSFKVLSLHETYINIQSYTEISYLIFNDFIELIVQNQLMDFTPKIMKCIENYNEQKVPSQNQFKRISEFYIKENLLLPLHSEWRMNLKNYIHFFYSGNNKEVVLTTLRVNFLNLVSTSDDVDDISFYTKCICDDKIMSSDDDHQAQNQLRTHITEILYLIHENAFSASLEVLVSEVMENGICSNTICKSLVHLMLKLVTEPTNSQKAILLFNSLIEIIKCCLSGIRTEECLIISRLLFRMRADSKLNIHFISIADTNGLCETLGRNLNTINNEQEKKELIKNARWFYPEELDYLPNEALVSSKRCITTKDIPLSKWLSVVVDVIKNHYNWEIYSYYIGHFCPQLSFSNLFADEANRPTIHNLMEIICQNIHSKSLSVKEKPQNISKEDIQVAYIRTLSSIPGYKSWLSKADQDQIIGSVISALQSWNKTAIPCIHFLNISCYEFGSSIKKYLSPILTVLQTRISMPYTAAHILDFIMSLSQIPLLSSTFNTEEFKRIFGIAFKYIQYSNEMKEEAMKLSTNMDHTIGTVDNQTSTQQNQLSSQLLNYLKALAYRAISNWFLKMSLAQRRTLSAFIMKNLLSPFNNSSSKEIDELNIANIDFLTRFTFSELDIRTVRPADITNLENNPMYLRESWIYGLSLVTIYTDKIHGDSEIIVRRPTSVTFYSLKIQDSMFPDWLYRLQNTTNLDDMPIIFTPSFVMLQVISPLTSEKMIKPEPLLDNPVIERSTNNLDRIPTIYFQKSGIMYIGPNQQTEQEILSNRFGSREYHKFLSELGSVIKLKDNKSFYTGGLDTNSDSDGEYAIHFTSETHHLIFHTATLMPNNPNDPQFSMKKRHIGNNYVNVYWDESGHPFDFNRIATQFSFISIVITPIRVIPKNPQENCYRVKLYRRSGIPALFSICHFKLISEENLPIFIRNTCNLAVQLSDAWNSSNTFEFNWTRRIKQLKLIREKNATFLKTEAEERSIELDIQNQTFDSSASMTLHPVISPEEEEISGNANSAKNDIQNSFLSQLSKVDIGGKIAESMTPSSYVTDNRKEFYEHVKEEEDEKYKNLEFNSFT